MLRTQITPDGRAALIDTAHRLADAARNAILPRFRTRDLQTMNKAAGAFDPVTAADRDSETAMRAILAEARPDDGILGEEFPPVAGTSGLTWVLDPIDGTRGFISGTPTWGVLIAIADAEGPFFGVIDQPYIGERFIGGLGLAEMSGPQGTAPLAARSETRLSEATIFTTFPEIGEEADRAAFRRLASLCNLTRYGMDCYAYALVAAGQIDLVVEAGLAPYDIQAPIAVVEAAGGIVTDWRGGNAHEGGNVVAAANAELHAAALEALNA